MLKEIRDGYIGNPSQLVTVRRMRLQEGRGKGTEIIEVSTAGGLSLDILPDAGLDFGQARYKGINVSWMCKNGYDSPAVISSHETEFSHTFPGGLMYTCGLRSTGGANRDKGEWHPAHGRYHSLQADHIGIQVTDEEITVSGTIRETALFGHALAVFCEFEQQKKELHLSPMVHQLFGWGQKSVLNKMTEGYAAADREAVARIFETVWPAFADFVRNTFDKRH